MGAPNFHRANTSKVFAVLMNQERTFKVCSECEHKHYDYEYSEQGFKDLSVCEYDCEDAVLTQETEYEPCESYEYDEFKEYLRETAETKVKDTPYRYTDQEKNDNDRNYCATDLFSLSTYKMFGDIEVNLTITGQIVSAYYEGASLDYRLEVGECEIEDGYFKLTIEDALDDLFSPQYVHYNSDMNKGLRKIQMRNAIKWAKKETEKMIETIENIFTQVSQPLNVVAQFSNGETIYQAV